MGENYTRKTENYTARQNKHPNASTVQQPKVINFTCWKCHKDFSLPIELAKPDHVTCIFCGLTHGLITHSKDA